MKKLLLFSLLCCLLFSPGAAWGASRSYSVDKVDIVARLLPNGNAAVTESITLSFKGEYTRFIRDIPTEKPIQIKDIAISEDGKVYRQLKTPSADRPPDCFAVLDSDGKRNIEFYYRAKDTRKTFILSYTIENAVQIHNDIAELNRRFIDTDWDEIKEVNIKVLLPPGAKDNDILIWSHSSLHGKFIKKSPQEADFSIKRLPKGMFAELRVVAPLALFPDGTRKTDKLAKEDILKEENFWADDANKKRREIEESKGALQPEPEEGIWGKITGGISFALSGLALYQARKKMKESVKLPPDAPKYCRDLPSALTPAEAGALCESAGICDGGQALFTATFLDLAAKDFFELESNIPDQNEDPENIFLRINTKEDASSLKEHEKALLQVIKDALGSGGTLGSLTEYINSQPKKVSELLGSFQQQNMQSLRNQGYIKNEYKRSGMSFLRFFTGLLALLFAAMSDYDFILSLLAYLAMASCIFNKGSYGFTDKGLQEAALWRAMKNFFNDFTLFDEKDLPELAVWQRFLAYAVALGEGEKLMQSLPLRYPELTTSSKKTVSSLRRLSNKRTFEMFSSVGSNMKQAVDTHARKNRSSGRGRGGGSSSGSSRGDRGGGGRAD